MFLSEELLQEIHERAPRYDKENAWPAEDYAALKEAGYLKSFVPKEYGGFGLSLKEIAQEQTRLAMAAPGTALGVNMHQIIVWPWQAHGSFWQQEGRTNPSRCCRRQIVGVLGFLNLQTTACYSVRFLRLVRKRAARIVSTARKSSYQWANIATSWFHLGKIIQANHHSQYSRI